MTTEPSPYELFGGSEYWGGPKTYGELRGHPRLRMRHAEFHIDAKARDRWLVLMHAALEEQDIPHEYGQELWEYLASAAFAMQNVDDDLPTTHAGPKG